MSDMPNIRKLLAPLRDALAGYFGSDHKATVSDKGKGVWEVRVTTRDMEFPEKKLMMVVVSVMFTIVAGKAVYVDTVWCLGWEDTEFWESAKHIIDQFLFDNRNDIDIIKRDSLGDVAGVY